MISFILQIRMKKKHQFYTSAFLKKIQFYLLHVFDFYIQIHAFYTISKWKHLCILQDKENYT